jgi:hypothetical protein
MFNLFFRRYLPGFRLGPDGVPRFNIDDNSLPQRESASSDGTLPNSAAPVVVAQGAKVRKRAVWLDGVSYSTYCFECEELDIRSWVLQLILRNAGVKMARGTLPGKIRP